MQAFFNGRAETTGNSPRHNTARLHLNLGRISTAITAGVLPLAIGTSLATLVALRVLGRVDHTMLLWPVSGTALALALPHWHQGWPKRKALLLAAAGGFLVTAAATGMPVPIACMIAMLTCADLLIVTAILGPAVRTFDDLKYQTNILRFLVAVVCAPILTGTLGAYPVSRLLRLPPLQTGLMSIMADSLGMAMLVPTVLFLVGARRHLALRRPWLPIHGIRVAAVLTCFVAVSSYVFWQTTNPFLFMVFPPMMLVLLMLGLEGAVLTSLVLTAISWFGTSHGHGPICLVRGVSPLYHLLILQGFIWICISTGLPVGALLDERKRADQSAKQSQSIYQLLLQHTDGLIILSSMDGTQRYISPAIARLAGWSQPEYLAMDRFETLHPQDQALARQVIGSLSAREPEHTFRYRMRHKAGTWVWVEATVRAYGIEDDAIAGYVGTVRDISTIKQAEESWVQERRGLVQQRRQMADLANTDPLTGLLNRRGFEEKMRVFADRRLTRTLLMVDLDFFKKYNDTYGHQAGDACLVRVAAVLRSQAARSNDLVARLGGEEFAVFLPGVELSGGLLVAEKIRNALRNLALEHKASSLGIVTLSVGAAAHSASHEPNTKLLFSQADSALYAAKRKRDAVSAFDRSASVLSA
jgi:diguanylate cyclase (GGDEF)-like protein/PAS domain S-box-containing protein